MAAMLVAGNGGTGEKGAMQALPTSEDSGSQVRINNDENASSSAVCMSAATLTSTGKGGGSNAADSGVGFQRVGKGSGGRVESSFPLGPLPEVGVATTCHACKELRVSRTVTCRSCGATFHWSCIGFYEHLYRRPKEDWRCSDCAIPTGEREAGLRKGTEERSLGGKGEEDKTAVDQMVQAAQDSEQELEECIDVGVPQVNSLSAVIPPSVAALISGSAQGSPTEEVKEASPMEPLPSATAAALPTVVAVTTSVVSVMTAVVSSTTASAAAATGASTGVTSTIASPATDEASTSTAVAAGERICPVCKKDIGRKRTLDCSVCRKPSHAGCVNVRGAETPKSWVCRDCRDRSPDGAGTGEVGEKKAAGLVALPAGGAQNAECEAVSTDRKYSEQPDLLGQLLNGQSSGLTRAALTDSSKGSSSRSDGEVTGLNDGGSSREMGKDCFEGEAPADRAESEQGNSVLAPCSTETDGTVAKVSATQQNEKSAGVGVSENAEEQRNGTPEEDRGWDSDMDLTVDDSQQERLLIRSSRRKSSTKRKSLLLPPPPPPPPSLSSPNTQPSTESAQAPDTLEMAKTAPPAPGATAAPSTESTQASGTPESLRIAPPAPGVTAVPSLPPPSTEQGKVLPLPPFDPPPQYGRTPPALPGFESYSYPRARHPSSGAESFSPMSEGCDVLKRSSKAQTPLPVSSLPPPSPLLLPLLPPSAPRSASAVGGMTDPSSLEMVPLGKSKSSGKTPVLAAAAASQPSGAKATGSRAPEAGKKSFLFSEQEQKAMADSNSGVDTARGAGKVSKGKLRVGAQMVSTKLKGKKTGFVSRPTVASVFTNEGQVAKSQKKTQLGKAGGGMDLSKKHISSPSKPRENGNEINLQKVIASIAERGAERRTSAVGSCTPESSSDARSRTGDSRGSRTPSAQPPPMIRSGSSSDNLSAQTRTSEGYEQTPRPRRLSHWGPRPTCDFDASRANQGTVVERTQEVASKTAEGSSSRNGGGASDRGRGRPNGYKSENRRSNSRSSSSSSSNSTSSSESTSSSSSAGRRRSKSRSKSGDFRRRSVSRSASSNRIRSHARSDSERRSGRVGHRHEERRSGRGGGSREFYGRHENKNRGGDRSRLGYRSGPRRNDRVRSDDRYHREPSYEGGRGGRYGKNAGGSRSRDDRDSRERSFNRTGSRGEQNGKKGERKTGKRYEPSKSWNGVEADNSDRHATKRDSPPLSRDRSYGKGERNLTNASAARDQTGREVSRERGTSDAACESRDHRVGDSNRSRNTESRGMARDVDEHVVRARREEGNQESTPCRADERRSAESCSSVSASPRCPPDGSARPATTTCNVSIGRSSDGSATRSRELGDDPSPLVRSALSSAYDRVPMPTTSLEYNPSSIGVEDLFSSLEDQFPDPVIRGAEVAATPGRSGCQSSLGSSTSATAGAFVSATATTAVPDSPAPASAAIAVAPVAATLPPSTAAAPAASTSEQLVEGDEANGGRLVNPTSRDVSPLSNQAVAASERGDGGDKSGPEANDLAITNESNLVAESLAAATASPQKEAGDVQVTAMISSRTTEVTPPLPPLMPIPMPSAGAPGNPASTATAEAPRVESSIESSPMRAREMRGESGAIVAGTVVRDSGPSSMFGGASMEAGCTSEGVGGNARNPDEPFHRLAVAGDGDVAPTDSVEDRRTGREQEARKENAKQASHSIQEADGDEEKDEVDAGGVVDQGEVGRVEEGKEEEKGDEERCDEGEDEEQQEEEGSEKGGSVASMGGVKRAKRSNPWYRKGTLVVLNCGPDMRPGRPRPSVPIADLLGRLARVVEQPRVIKGPRFHTVEFQRWEGGPGTAVEMKVRASLLRPADAGATDKKDHPSHAREAHIPRLSASSGGAAAVPSSPSSPSISLSSSASQESFSRASLGIMREGALTRKAARDMERSFAATNASPKDRGSWAKGGGNGGEVRAEKGSDSDDMELDEDGDSDREGQDDEGSDKGEEAQKDGDGRKESRAANETAVSAESAGPGVDSKYPMFFPVGARVILKKPMPNKSGPRGPPIGRDELIGKTAIVTRAGTYLNGPKYHAIRFEPWPGGPSGTITWTVPRKCLTPYQANAVEPGTGTGDSSVKATDADLASASVSASTSAPASVPPDKGPSGGGASSGARAEVGEVEADRSRGAVMSQPPSSIAAYPPGTVVVVHSLDVDPGRTLKFARNETYEATFKELIGREGKVVDPPPPSRKGFRYHLVEYQPWEGGPTKPFTWYVKMSALDVLRWPPPQSPSLPENEEKRRNGKVSKSVAAETEGVEAAVPQERESGASPAVDQEAVTGPEARGATEESGCARASVHGLTRVRARDNVEGGRRHEDMDGGEMSSSKEQGAQAHKSPPVQLPLPVTSPLQTLVRLDRESIPRRARPDHVCALPSTGSGEKESARATTDSSAGVESHDGNKDDAITKDPDEGTGGRIVAAVGATVPAASASTTPNNLEAGRERQRAPPDDASNAPTGALTKRRPRRSSSAVASSPEPDGQAGRGLAAPVGAGLDKGGPAQVAAEGTTDVEVDGAERAVGEEDPRSDPDGAAGAEKVRRSKEAAKAKARVARRVRTAKNKAAKEARAREERAKKDAAAAAAASAAAVASAEGEVGIESEMGVEDDKDAGARVEEGTTVKASSRTMPAVAMSSSVTAGAIEARQQGCVLEGEEGDDRVEEEEEHGEEQEDDAAPDDERGDRSNRGKEAEVVGQKSQQRKHGRICPTAAARSVEDSGEKEQRNSGTADVLTDSRDGGGIAPSEADELRSRQRDGGGAEADAPRQQKNDGICPTAAAKPVEDNENKEKQNNSGTAVLLMNSRDGGGAEPSEGFRLRSRRIDGGEAEADAPRQQKDDRICPTAAAKPVEDNEDKEKRNNSGTAAVLADSRDRSRAAPSEAQAEADQDRIVLGDSKASSLAARDADTPDHEEATPSARSQAKKGSEACRGSANVKSASVSRAKPESGRAEAGLESDGGAMPSQETSSASVVGATEAGAVDVQRLMTMVQGLQEDMQGLKTQLKKRHRSNVEGGGGSDGGRHHSRGRRTSRGPPSVHRHGRRGPSSSPSEVDSDRDSQLGGSSSSDFETTRLKGPKRMGRRYRNSRSNALAPPPPLSAMGTVPRGYYPYHPMPPGAYPYMHPPPGSYYYGPPPSHGAAAAYPALYPGTAYGGHGSEAEVAGGAWEEHRRSEKHRRHSGSELSHSRDHRFWDGESRGGWATLGVGRGGAVLDGNENWRDGGAVAAASRSLGVERVVADGKGERGGEKGVRSGDDEGRERASSPRGDRGGHGAETASGRKRKAERRAAGSGSSPGASGPHQSKRRRRYSEGARYRPLRETGYHDNGDRFLPAGFAYPPPVGATAGVGDHPFASTPPPLAGPGGGYAHASPYQVPSDPRTMYDGHFPKARGWGDGHPYTAAAAPVHPHRGHSLYDDRHGSRRRQARLPVPENVGDERMRSTPRGSSVGGGSGVEHGGSPSRRSVESKSRSRSPSESGGDWESEGM